MCLHVDSKTMYLYSSKSVAEIVWCTDPMKEICRYGLLLYNVVLCRRERDMTFPACGGRLTQQKPRTYHRKFINIKLMTSWFRKRCMEPVHLCYNFSELSTCSDIFLIFSLWFLEILEKVLFTIDKGMSFPLKYTLFLKASIPQSSRQKLPL